jgi:hypothetical protein
MVRPSKTKRTNLRPVEEVTLLRACELCGIAGKQLTHTACCGNLICDDEDEYVAFSYARNSCFRNHNNQTLCAFHHHREHTGVWKECSSCQEEFEPEMYAWFATNPYNFERLKNPPAFEPTHCDGCGERIVLPLGGYTLAGGKRWCDHCEPPRAPRRRSRSRRAGV